MSQFSLYPQRHSNADLITHVRALLTIVRPEHLRKAEVQEAMANVAEKLGADLSVEEVQRVVARSLPQPRKRAKGGAA